MEITSNYGAVYGIQDISLQKEDTLGDVEKATSIPPEGGVDLKGNMMWEYQKLGRINGVPVKESDKHLKLDSADRLIDAFQLDRRPVSLVFHLAPDNEDDAKKYNDILDGVHDGSLEIIDEIRQFDQDKGWFVVWIRYNELQYVLNPRYSWLRED